VVKPYVLYRKNMTIKLKYSSVLQISFCKLKKVNDRKRHLVIKGPLGISYLSESIFPSGFKVKLNDKKKSNFVYCSY
jgi:hypothetical protein